MICLYCNNKCEPSPSLINSYPYCLVCKVSYEIDYQDNLLSILFLVKNKSIELNYQRNETILHETGISILKLNYLEDINPGNAKKWMKKLLNMKAFS